MSKQKSLFVCQNCGTNSPKWMGKCNACGEWNSYVEEIINKEPSNSLTHIISVEKAKPILLDDVENIHLQRIETNDSEFNRVLGGGIVPGSMVLIGGDPGIGKSTLLIQIAMQTIGKKILYISGEESEQQIKMRAQRIGGENNLVYVFTETNVETILQHADQIKPDILIIDSIQTVQTARAESVMGSVSQIRETANILQQYAKKKNVPTFLIGHITKEGYIAGPKILEHIVDTVLQFEGDRNYNYRILRTLKNRFGSGAELGIYEMRGEGLRPVSNPSEILITSRDEPVSGVAIAATMEGQRALLIEVQALVSASVYGTPQRSSNGFDGKRLSMILAVLDKRCGFTFSTKDVFLNIAGGIKVEDPAVDLAVVAALLSSYQDLPIGDDVCFSGEVGLSGEIRAVNKIDQRILEAEKLGYKRIFISKYNQKTTSTNNIKVELVKKVEEIFSKLFVENVLN